MNDPRPAPQPTFPTAVRNDALTEGLPTTLETAVARSLHDLHTTYARLVEGRWGGDWVHCGAATAYGIAIADTLHPNQGLTYRFQSVEVLSLGGSDSIAAACHRLHAAVDTVAERALAAGTAPECVAALSLQVFDAESPLRKLAREGLGRVYEGDTAEETHLAQDLLRVIQSEPMSAEELEQVDRRWGHTVGTILIPGSSLAVFFDLTTKQFHPNCPLVTQIVERDKVSPSPGRFTLHVSDATYVDWSGRPARLAYLFRPTAKPAACLADTLRAESVMVEPVLKRAREVIEAARPK